MGWLNKQEGRHSVMPLLAQWARQRPWLAAGIASAAGGVAGLAGGIAAAASAVGGMAMGSISTKTSPLEHPLRRRIL